MNAIAIKLSKPSKRGKSKSIELNLDPAICKSSEALLFENLPELISVSDVKDLIGYSRATVYDWKARPWQYGIPREMFFKSGRRLYIRTRALKKWFLTRSSS